MKDKLTSIKEKIKKCEARQREIDAELKSLRQQKRQIEDENILSMVRELAGENEDFLEALRLVNQSNDMEAAKKKEAEEHEK